MSRLPRVAIGTIQPEADAQAMLWALMDLLRSRGIEVQSFLSQALFPPHPGAAAITGLDARHLDSWLMSPETCGEAFVRGARSADLALVEGRFDPSGDPEVRGGRLEPLCEWLDLPRVAIVDVSEIGPCRLPRCPQPLDGLLLDRVSDRAEFARLATDLESLWRAPVLGALEDVPKLRGELAAIPRGNAPPRELCHQLGEQLARWWNPDRLLDLAYRREMPHFCPQRACCGPAETELTVAIAYDEAFNCYFPDALDMLEARGASVVDFSPLRDEHLPPQADVVYFGCGHPERYAATLSENHCMTAALRSHLCAGRRVYGEGGGAAYLCQQMETPDGEFKRMVGVLPAVARLVAGPRCAEPLELTLSRPNWLGNAGAQVRGYQNASWRLEPTGELTSFLAEPAYQYCLVGSFHSVGSLVHLDFAVQPAFLDHFFCPETPNLQE
jgi:cobyrinic acid a,c-diamide synthase